MGFGVDARLQAALKRPGLEVAMCDDPFAVLAVLTNAHLGGAGAKILLLIEPQRLPHVVDLLNLAPRYVPEMAIWLFDPARQPVLKAARVGDVLAALGVKAAPKPGPVVAPTDESRASGPVAWTGPWVASTTQKWSEPSGGLRLAGEGTLPARDEVREDDVEMFADGKPAPEAAPKRNQRVLTDEELAMLLGDGRGAGGGKS